MSTAAREYLEDWQRSLDRDPEYAEWLAILEIKKGHIAKNRKEEKSDEHNGKSER